MTKKILNVILCSALCFTAIFLVSCDKSDSQESSDNETIVIGVSPIPHEEIIRALLDDFAKEGLDVKIKVFDDYVQPNLALSDGDLDANYFQHNLYLESFCAERNLNLVNIGAVHLEPMGFYSEKIKSLDELKAGDEILIPNDPTNGGRALLLVQQAELIKLKNPEDVSATEADVVENKLDLKFTALDAANIPNVYTDVAGGIINTNFALGAGLNPENAILAESATSPYVNVIAVRAGEENEPKFQKLMKVLHSEKCKNFIEKTYGGAIFPAF